MKYLFTCCLGIASFALSAQCVVDSIVFHTPVYCDSITQLFTIPVTTYFQGSPSIINIDLEGTHYEHNNQNYTPIAGQELNFVTYAYADGFPKSETVTSTLLGGTCSGQFLTETYSFNDPTICEEEEEGEEQEQEETCLPFLQLTGTVSGTTELYESQDSIHSDQHITTGSDVTIQAGISITLLPGFEAGLGSEVLIQIESCDP